MLFRAALAASRAVRGDRIGHGLLCIGDSLTGAYPAPLSMMLGRSVQRRSYGGKTSDFIVGQYSTDESLRSSKTVVLWAGNNNYFEPDSVAGDIAKFHRLASDKRVLVVGLINGNFPDRRKGESGYNSIVAANETLRSAYGERFFDIRPILNARTSVGDEADQHADVLPRSLRVDDIHFNRRANLLVASLIYQKLRDLGWAR